MAKELNRREFLAAGAGIIIIIGSLTGPHLGSPAAALASSPTRVIYRLSLRGRRGSKAARRHNANKRFATQEAANLHRAHPGDRSRIVPLTVSEGFHHMIFPIPTSLVADLRTVTHSSCVGDCGGDGTVTIDELLAGVNIALGNASLEGCTAFDTNRDKRVTVDELLSAVNRALSGCG